jgi:hypothetical protein
MAQKLILLEHFSFRYRVRVPQPIEQIPRLLSGADQPQAICRTAGARRRWKLLPSKTDEQRK